MLLYSARTVPCRHHANSQTAPVCPQPECHEDQLTQTDGAYRSPTLQATISLASAHLKVRHMRRGLLRRRSRRQGRPRCVTICCSSSSSDRLMFPKHRAVRRPPTGQFSALSMYSTTWHINMLAIRMTYTGRQIPECLFIQTDPLQRSYKDRGGLPCPITSLTPPGRFNFYFNYTLTWLHAVLGAGHAVRERHHVLGRLRHGRERRRRRRDWLRSRPAGWRGLRIRRADEGSAGFETTHAGCPKAVPTGVPTGCGRYVGTTNLAPSFQDDDVSMATQWCNSFSAVAKAPEGDRAACTPSLRCAISIRV